jgi:hypothetical protein
MLDVGFWILDVGYWLQVAGCRLHGKSSKFRV